MGPDTVRREDAKRPTSGCRFRRKPTRVAATHPQDEEQPTAHLENCTGKKLISAKLNLIHGRFQSEVSQRKQITRIKQLQPFLNSLRKAVVTELARSSEQERRVDARALIADEGRDKLR